MVLLTEHGPRTDSPVRFHVELRSPLQLLILELPLAGQSFPPATAGLSPCFHLLGFHGEFLFLTHSRFGFCEEEQSSWRPGLGGVWFGPLHENCTREEVMELLASNGLEVIDLEFAPQISSKRNLGGSQPSGSLAF